MLDNFFEKLPKFGKQIIGPLKFTCANVDIGMTYATKTAAIFILIY